MAKTNDFDLDQNVYFIIQEAENEDTVNWVKKIGKVIGIRHTLKTDGAHTSKYKLQVPPVKPEEEIWVEPQNIYVQEAAATKRLNDLKAEQALEFAKAKVEDIKVAKELAIKMKEMAEAGLEKANEALKEAEAELAKFTKEEAPAESAEDTLRGVTIKMSANSGKGL